MYSYFMFRNHVQTGNGAPSASTQWALMDPFLGSDFSRSSANKFYLVLKSEQCENLPSRPQYKFTAFCSISSVTYFIQKEAGSSWNS
jgi:hypothetical protein